MTGVSIFDPGSDTVTLVHRTYSGTVFDAYSQPAVTETRVDKSGCSWSEHPATEDVASAQVAVIKAVGHLPVDADTEALAATDAVEFRGRLFEMAGPAVRRDDLDGQPDHVRAEAIWAADVSIGERVVIIPAAGRDVDGNYGAAGTPIPVVARAVVAGNQTRRFGAGGAVVAADFTVILDLDAPIGSDDWIEVRGRTCRVLIGEQLSQWQARQQLVVLARSAEAGD